MSIMFQKYKLPVLIFILLSILAFGLHINSLADKQKRTLLLGDRGSDVTKVQKRLIELKLYEDLPNGYYGIKTHKAVQDFQKKKNLPVTGYVNQKTWQEIFKEPVPPPANEVNLLARVVEGEAADEPYIGKLAVAAVLLNRVKSPSFPNTLPGVVYQPGAFESVSNGQYNRSLSSDSLKAARAAFDGSDPTGGAIFFWNPAKPVNAWVWQRTIVTTIGRHVFAI